jgi:hypothetical protein
MVRGLFEGAGVNRRVRRSLTGGWRPIVAGAAIGVLLATSIGIGPADANFTKRQRDAARKDAQPALPPGQLHIVINIGKQQLSLYSDGALIARSPVSTGTKTHPTPTGVFSIIQKRRHHVSNLYYASMPFMQRLTWSGVALHQGALPGYAASHGCVRLPSAFAQTLWKTTKIGARVVITRHEPEPYTFSHASLPMPASATSAQADTPQRSAGIKTAQADTRVTDASGPDANAANLNIDLPPYPPASDVTLEIKKSIEPNDIAEKPLPSGPVSVFVSRKLKRMFVRKGFAPLFDVPVEIKDETKPFGTHVFTATAGDGGLRWLALSLPADPPKAERRKSTTIMQEERSARPRKNAPVQVAEPASAAPSAAEVLDRLVLPQNEMQRVREMLTAGASFMVSDHGISDETGEGTDFVVLTR